MRVEVLAAVRSLSARGPEWILFAALTETGEPTPAAMVMVAPSPLDAVYGLAVMAVDAMKVHRRHTAARRQADAARWN